MPESIIIDFTIKGMVLVLLLSMPAIVMATVAGLGVSIVQALTQIQEQTLGFAVKLIVVIAVLLFSASWMTAELYKYSNYLFTSFHLYAK